MAFINLTPHAVSVFTEDAFENLEEVKPGVWVADRTTKTAIGFFNATGKVARIATQTVEVESLRSLGVKVKFPAVKTTYGEAVGIPDDVTPEDYLIVSLPMQSMARASGHPLAGQMIAPYKVVRDRQNGSIVLGCMGFTF